MILLTLWLFRSLLVVHTAAFLAPNQPSKRPLLLSTWSWELLATPVFRPIFDFTDSSRNETERFERLDDAIMGGISTSSLRQVSGEDFARWSGVCRLDGGYVSVLW
jgi:Complex I intermediate-associated protein 30 (CIA30)